MAKLLGTETTNSTSSEVPAWPRRRRALGLRAKLAVLALLAVASFGVYLGVSPSRTTQAQRISYLETIVKCPTCISVSTKDANTASAFALRTFITQMVHQGASNSQIIDQLLATYGPSVLLVPPSSSGGTALAGAGIALVLGIPLGGLLYYRRRGRKPVPEPPEGATSNAGGEPLTGGANRSASERAPGWIRTALGSASLAQKLVGAVGVALILSGGGLLAYGVLAKPSNVLSPSQIVLRLKTGEQLATVGSDTQALQLFSTVLAADPRQPEALAWNGWLLRQAGRKDHSRALLAAGIAQLRQSVAIQPAYLYGRLFYGISLYQDSHDAKGAVQQFRAYLSLSPPKSLTNQVKPTIDGAFAAAKLPAPL
ncbi:MAG: cytochrome c-type biogenesis protein CcmH [Actinomycetota bacterium]|nr:cytochrome c-type biogenesis protein CcmH [Actinomycetota bacterium]